MAILAGVVLLGLLVGASIVLPAFVGGAWSPTPRRAVRRGLELAEAKPGERLFDLGAGDGRVVLLAARQFGLEAVGIEVDPVKAWLIAARARLRGVGRRVRVERSNFFDVDLSPADIVFFYLSPAAAARLRPKFEAELRPQARVVSYRRPIEGWRPWRQEGGLYVYRMSEARGEERSS